MEIPKLPKLPSLDEAKQALARALVELAWDSGPHPQTFEVEHEGARWQVEVRVKDTEDTPLEKDYAEELPE